MFRFLTGALLVGALAWPTQRLDTRAVTVRAQTDSTATLVASWSASNADSVRVTYSTGVTRTRVAARRVDTLVVPKTATAQTITVTFTPIRRTTVGAARTASVTVAARVVVEPPPTVDSVRVDTVGTATPPVIVPPPPTPAGVLYAHGFDDGTLGQFAPWGSPAVVTDATAVGGRAVRFTWQTTGGADQDQGLAYHLTGAHKTIYARFRYKQDATANNGGIKKTVRIRATINGVEGRAVGTFNIQEGTFLFNGDDYSVAPWNIVQTNGSTHGPQTFRNAWRTLEVMLDYSTPGRQRVGLWVDGVRVITYDGAVTLPADLQLREVWLASVFNGPSDTRTEWFDEAVISTAYIGPP